MNFEFVFSYVFSWALYLKWKFYFSLNSALPSLFLGAANNNSNKAVAISMMENDVMRKGTGSRIAAASTHCTKDEFEIPTSSLRLIYSKCKFKWIFSASENMNCFIRIIIFRTLAGY